uniref:Protein CHUP1, chloroplastic n=1 Tax=Caenorhabditis tropicalis TaxID=1561998 RepID=A0A1I7TI54_9PELO
MRACTTFLEFLRERASLPSYFCNDHGPNHCQSRLKRFLLGFRRGSSRNTQNHQVYGDLQGLREAIYAETQDTHERLLLRPPYRLSSGRSSSLTDIIGQEGSVERGYKWTVSAVTTVNFSVNGSSAEGFASDQTAVPKDILSTRHLGASNQDKELIKMVLAPMIPKFYFPGEETMIIKQLQEDLKVPEIKRLDSEASNESTPSHRIFLQPRISELRTKTRRRFSWREVQDHQDAHRSQGEKSKIIRKLQEDLKVSEEKRLDSGASNESKLKESELRGKALESQVKALKREMTLQEIWINDTEWGGKTARDKKVALEQFIAMQQAALNKIISQLEMENGYLKEKLREAMANEERFWKVQEVKEKMVEEEESTSKASRKRQRMDDEGRMGIDKRRREELDPFSHLSYRIL